MNNWAQLLNTALLGTERQPLDLPVEDGTPVAPLLTQVESDNPETHLLHAAALYTQYQRTSFLPPHEVAPLPPVAEPDDQPPVPSHAASHLQRMLDGYHAEVLPEWLTAVQTNNQRIPPELLPALLTHGANKSNLRQAIIAVIGQRGRWLAALNTPWHYASHTPDISQWESATGLPRLLLLQQLRATFPNEARALLQSTWQTEKADDRTAFLACLATNLSLADEPFLESCLDNDRSQKVRQTAVTLLARLPDSQLVGRMIERVRPLLKLEGLLRPSLSVTLPGKVDAAGQRDGLQPGKAPSPLRLGEKAWHLCQMLAFVPATVWSEQWRKTPEQVLEMAGRSDEAAILREGWSRAAQNHPQLAWTTALIHHGGTVVDLVNALPPDQRESCIISLVNAKAYEDNDTLFQWLGTCRHGWSEAYGRLVIEQVRQVVAAPGQQNQNRNRLLLFGHYFPPQLIEEAARVWKPHPDNTDIWQPVIDNFLELLHFRREMLAALT